MVAFTIVLALLMYKYITVFIELVAASTCSPLAFTLPALFHYKLIRKSKLNLTIVIATILLTIFMVTTSSIALVRDLTE